MTTAYINLRNAIERRSETARKTAKLHYSIGATMKKLGTHRTTVQRSEQYKIIQMELKLTNTGIVAPNRIGFERAKDEAAVKKWAENQEHAKLLEEQQADDKNG